MLKTIAILSTLPLALMFMAGALSHGRSSLGMPAAAAAASEAAASTRNGRELTSQAGEIDAGKSRVAQAAQGEPKTVPTEASPPKVPPAPATKPPTTRSFPVPSSARTQRANPDRQGTEAGTQKPPSGPIDPKNPGGAQNHPSVKGDD